MLDNNVSTPLISIIAEIGINHNGSTDEARQLIEASSNAGVDGIKFQYRNIKNLYSSSNEIGDEMLLSELNRTHIKAEDIVELSRYARSLNLKWGLVLCRRYGSFKLNEEILITIKFHHELGNELIDKTLMKDRLYISNCCHNE